ncbi:hypothetical protein GOBAR_AA35150 [Gossypium barbadense]|uniref:Reverse transcriptase zinc-binding domain-containing protein n=1 Tax=Gossypium barbadense TaxID=3634 RepID=A0A2P5W369_GOSBA|nr:hypothetical protein GOBAR_AA35150 [Gossypium barbadense]
MGSTSCRRCQTGAKTREHLFRECPTAKETWEKLNIIWPISDANTDFEDWIKNIFDSHSMAKCKMIACFVINYLKELDGLNMHLLERRIHTDRWVALLGLRVLNLGLHLRLREVEIEGDSQPVIRKLESNKVAHVIASGGIKKRETTYLMHMVPSGVEEVMADD